MDAVREDHRLLQSYYNTIVNSDDADEQTRYQNQFTWELARHAVGEELVLYPAIDKYLRDGIEAANKDRRESETIKEKLKVFQDLNSSDPRFIPTITILMDDLEKHMHEEETVDLVKLEGAITAEESHRLANSFGRTKMFVPTRAHPSALDKALYNTAFGLMTAPVDHLQDIFRKWPDEMINPSPYME